MEVDDCIGDVPAAAAAARKEIEALLGYSFHNRSLLEEALTHSSYADNRRCPSYERLEFVGDAALGLALTSHLYMANPGLGPGQLTAIRAANISTEKLARVAVRHRLYRFLRRESPALDRTVSKFTEMAMLESGKDVGALLYGGSALKAPKVLADIVESIVGAVYVDCNFDLVLLWKVFRGFLEPIVTEETVDQQPVAMLHQLCDKQGKKLEFRSWRKDSGTVTNAVIDGELVGVGFSEQKIISKLNAARDALQKFSVDLEAQCSIGVDEEIQGSKQRLHELCCKNRWSKPIYKIESEHGPSHSKRYVCSVQVKTYITLGEQKPRVKDAENAAASRILNYILTNNK